MRMDLGSVENHLGRRSSVNKPCTKRQPWHILLIQNKIFCLEFYVILTNKQVVLIPIYWIIFRAELSASYYNITSVVFSIRDRRHYRAIYKSLLFFKFKTQQSTFCFSEAIFICQKYSCRLIPISSRFIFFFQTSMLSNKQSDSIKMKNMAIR